jgi:hypothetical protein
MSEFVLLYRSTPEAHHEAMGTPERAKQSRARWSVWIQDVTAKGQLKSVGLPLEGSGSVVRGRSRSMTDGPYVETKEMVAGFSIIEAKDIAEAARIASGCPILEGGGSVEVRPVVSMG